MLKQTFLLALFLSVHCLFVSASGNKSLVKFTENKGQWGTNVLFRAQLDGGVLFLEKNCFTYNFYEKEKLARNHFRPQGSKPTKEELDIRSHAFRVTLKNAIAPQSITPQKRSTNYSNFFYGKNPAKWVSQAFDYEIIYYRNIYAGIDLEVNGKPNSMKYNFIVNPGADASKICLSYEGITKITDENGSLRIETPLTTIIESKPYAYQEINGMQVEVPCLFVIKENEVTFSIADNYRSDLPLVIDPVLIFSSYSGSSANNFGMTATYDNLGNLYAGGTAFSQGYPTSIGAFDSTYNGIVDQGRTDVVISKYNPTGTALLYSTYLGGAVSTEIVTSLIVNSNDELMLFGITGSSDFPVTPSAFDNTFNGGDTVIFDPNGTRFYNGTDLYVAKFSVDGTQLLASTFIGGTESDGVLDAASPLAINYGDFFRGEIQTDAAGNFYIASTTNSSDFPVTPGAFQTSQGGGRNDGCIFKMSSDLSQMLWCSYLGSTSDDAAFALTLDKNQNVIVTGGTQSPGFPTTFSVISGTYIGGTADAYVTKIKADGSIILRSTFIGTSQFDQSYFIQTDTLEHFYIFGQSRGSFPVTNNVYSNPGSKQFVAVLSYGLDTLLHSTVFGDGTNDIKLSPAAFLVDRCGNIYCSGWGGPVLSNNPMSNMPVTQDAFQPVTANGYDFYFIVFGPYLQLLQYGSYFGGNLSREHVDGGTSRFDPKGILYQSVCAGCQNFDDFPTFSVDTTVWSTVNNSTGCNNGVIKMDLNVQDTRALFTAFPKEACPYVDVTFTNQSLAGYNFYWDFGDGSPISTSVHATHAYSVGGTYIVSLIASSPFCGIDTTYDTINVYIPPVADFTNTGTYCLGDTIQFTNGSTSPASYDWDFGDNDSSNATNPSHVYPSAGNYTVTLVVVDTLGCTDTTSQNVSINALPNASINYTVDTCELTAMVFGNPTNAASYYWDFGDTGTDTLQNTSHTYDSSGTYLITLVVTDTAGCIDTVTQSISPYSFAEARFVYDIDTCSFMVQFTNQSINAIFNEWHFGDATNPSSSSNPVHAYASAGNYFVTLIVNPGTGCVDTVSGMVDLDDEVFAQYFIPNIFTPNNDSYNPRFTIKGLDFCDEFLIKVFNRWGELMFESTNVLDAWDGTYKGNDVPDGVYFYIIKGSKINHAGTVTVKRK